MGLQLKLSKVSLSADGTTLIVQDTTGNYNSTTNPGGYGTPNPVRATTLVQLRWKLYRDCNWLLISRSYQQSDIEAGYAITTINTGLSTVLNLLPDGVEEIQFLSGYAMSGTVTTIPGESTVTVVDLDISTLQPGMYISFQSQPTVLYLVKSISGGIITLDTPYGGSNTTEHCNQWYQVVLDVLIQTMGQNRIDDRLTRYTVDSITDTELENLVELTMDELAATARFNAGDIAGANDLALSVQSRCFKQSRIW